MDRFENNSEELMLIGPETIRVNQFPSTLGRNRKLVNIHLNDLSISRKHCEIVRQNGDYYVRDLGSSFGTYLNNELLNQNYFYQIFDNDNLKLGDVTYNIKIINNSSIGIENRAADFPNNWIDQDKKPNYHVTTALDYEGGRDRFPQMVLKSLRNSEFYQIDKTPFFVGSNYERNDLILPVYGLSDRHFEIKRENEQFYICDLNSSIGTSVNGIKLTSNVFYPLQGGDTICIGDQLFLFDYLDSPDW